MKYAHALSGLTIAAAVLASDVLAHGTVVFPMSRVYRVYRSNPENPSFALAKTAVQIDGKLSYYTWNELSRNIPAAVKAKLPPAFDYSPWVPDGQLASGGRVDKKSKEYPRTYAGLDQVSRDWPKTPLVAGDTITVRFLATAAHNPSVWDVWMTKPTWDASKRLEWGQMEFLGRPKVTFASRHYTFQLRVPANRTGHHVLWLAWQRDDPGGEVFFSTSDIDIRPAPKYVSHGKGCTGSNNTVPTLTNLTQPVIGKNLELEIDKAAALSFVTLLFGRRTSVDLGAVAPGCTLLATPDVLLPVGPWPGRKMKAVLPIPDDPGFLGLRFGLQALILDPRVVRLLAIALSNGGEATIGWQ